VRRPPDHSAGDKMPCVTRWEEVDAPVLRWVASERSSFIDGWELGLTIRPDPAPSEEVPRLDEREVHEALTRLKDDGLIDGKPKDFLGLAVWSRLRVTGRGRQVLGEWPELDRLNSAEGLRLLLDRLAGETEDPDERSSLKRLIGFLGSIGDGVVEKTLNDAAAAGVDEFKEEL
jgi:hypothetical protein